MASSETFFSSFISSITSSETATAAQYVILQYVCPSLGVILACAMCAAPVPSLQFALRQRRMGTLNPSPWAFMMGNCLGWVAYSFLRSDLFIFWANVPGFMLSIWLNACAIKLQYWEDEQEESTTNERGLRAIREVENEKDDDDSDAHVCPIHSAGKSENNYPIQTLGSNVRIGNISFGSQERNLITVITTWLVILSLVALLPSNNLLTHEKRVDVIGVAANLNLVFFFGAPLSSMLEVLRTKSSSSLHRGTLTLNTSNAIFWTAYGFAVKDIFIIVPNALGVVMGVIQGLLCLCYPQNRLVALDAGNYNAAHVDEGEEELELCGRLSKAKGRKINRTESVDDTYENDCGQYQDSFTIT